MSAPLTVGWAVLDNLGRVVTLERSAVIAADIADRYDGATVRPLTFADADLDDVEPDDTGKASPLHLLACAYAVLAALIVAGVAPAGTALAGLVAGAVFGVLGLAGVAAVRRAVAR